MNSPEFDTDPVKLLLPWYVNGTLRSEERRTVTEHLERCAECRAAVLELRRMSSAIENEQPVPLVPEPPVADFLKTALAQSPPKRDSRRIIRFAAAASVLGLIAVSYWLTTVESASNVYQTVTDNAGISQIAYVFDLEVAADADATVRAAVSTAVANSDIVGSENGYRVVIEMPSATMKELDMFADKLRQIEGVQRVDVIGVRLPVE